MNNVRREALVNGAMDNEDMNLLVLGVGDTVTSITFDECCSSTSIEVKFFQILNDDDC